MFMHSRHRLNTCVHFLIHNYDQFAPCFSVKLNPFVYIPFLADHLVKCGGDSLTGGP